MAAGNGVDAMAAVRGTGRFEGARALGYGAASAAWLALLGFTVRQVWAMVGLVEDMAPGASPIPEAAAYLFTAALAALAVFLPVAMWRDGMNEPTQRRRS